MRPLEEAQAAVLDAVGPLPVQSATLREARGLVLAEDVTAPHDIPPFANSAMDGYAVIAADVAEAPVTLPVLEDVPAGSVATQAVAPGTAIKIMDSSFMKAMLMSRWLFSMILAASATLMEEARCTPASMTSS